jgi:hypothetical protein
LGGFLEKLLPKSSMLYQTPRIHPSGRDKQKEEKPDGIPEFLIWELTLLL